MLAAKIEATVDMIEKVTEEYNALRQAEVTMHTLLGALYGDITAKLVEKMELDIHLQMLRQLEWSDNHPMRDSSTQVREFQLEQPQSMTLPIVYRTPPASPELRRVLSPPAIAPVARKVCGRGRGRGKMLPVAVVPGLTRTERVALDRSMAA